MFAAGVNVLIIISVITLQTILYEGSATTPSISISIFIFYFLIVKCMNPKIQKCFSLSITNKSMLYFVQSHPGISCSSAELQSSEWTDHIRIYLQIELNIIRMDFCHSLTVFIILQ